VSTEAKPTGEFVTVGRVGDLAPGEARQVTVDGRWVALFNVGGEFHAIDSVCLHRGGPLAEGRLTGCVVTCPWHGWQFDVRTGTFIQDPHVGVSRHDTRVVGDDVQVRVTD
jgi:nitrite reductase/ring-hydroxylating ferredoxin subunit